MLREQSWHCLVWLGAAAFATISGEVVKPVLLILGADTNALDSWFTTLDVSDVSSIGEKIGALRT